MAELGQDMIAGAVAGLLTAMVLGPLLMLRGWITRDKKSDD